MAVYVSKVIAKHDHVPRAKKKRRTLAREIMAFAAKVKPSIREERCAQFHKELSTITERMSISELRKFRRDIQKGKEDSWFPLSAMMKREGTAAEHITNFLGRDYVDLMIGFARSGRDIDHIKAGKDYLEWVSAYGGTKVRARALAGVANVAADEIERGNGDFLEREMIKKRGLMRVLTKNVGEKRSWEIVGGLLRERRGVSKVVAFISLMAGVCVASSNIIIQSISELKDVGIVPIAVMGSSAITGIVAGLSFLGTVNMGMLQRKIGKILKSEHGHV